MPTGSLGFILYSYVADPSAAVVAVAVIRLPFALVMTKATVAPATGVVPVLTTARTRTRWLRVYDALSVVSNGREVI